MFAGAKFAILADKSTLGEVAERLEVMATVAGGMGAHSSWLGLEFIQPGGDCAATLGMECSEMLASRSQVEGVDATGEGKDM